MVTVPPPKAFITLKRRIQLWNLVAQSGRAGITAAALHDHLQAEVDLRTVQRDLKTLSRANALKSANDPNGAGLLWRTDGCEPLEIEPNRPEPLSPGQLKSARVALSIVTVYEQARHLLHEAALEDMRDLYEQSRILLTRLQRSEGRWLGKVVTGTQHLQLQQAPVDKDMLHTVQQALLEGYQLEIDYYSRKSARLGRKVISPLGLSYQDSSIYVVCLVEGSPIMRKLALHRFQAIRPLAARSVCVPDAFELAEHVQRVHLEEAPIQLKLRINPALRERLDHQETPLSRAQTLVPEGDGWWLLECELEYTQGLVWWILSHGATVEVIEPLRLRQHIAATVRKMSECYAADSPLL